MMKKRCSWVEGKKEIYIKYHDEEWGVAKYNDDILFEMLVLESFQAGLSWITILKKREAFKEAFDNFNIEKIINYDESKVHELLENESIIRHEGKIRATINNAKVFKDIQKEEGSFSNYIWGFTDGKIIKAEYKTKSDLSDDIAKDLKKKGMKFVGSTTIYSYLEAIGIIDNHTKDCFRY
ncbi:DNA-3-methyladenine glycosylase I [uncultured Methanobrevibacter sp.]|uniref:DNA-3-methyladenine glycosylase I n=1 Tax=uncultured Methanobrevibacter sp. TaxID=253161 RepID=UPI0025FB78D2|nr:DNA-3-methyladenine glycosylase I [uncultured Methanobrevibacter sp.]